MIGGVIQKFAIENLEFVVANIMGLAKRMIELLGAYINIGDSIVIGLQEQGDLSSPPLLKYVI